MVNGIFGSLPDFVRQSLLISFVAWLAIQLLYQAVRQGEGLLFEGLYSFLAVSSLITVVNYSTNGRSSPAMTALAFSLLGIGFLASLIRAVVWVFSPKQRSGKNSG